MPTLFNIITYLSTQFYILSVEIINRHNIVLEGRKEHLKHKMWKELVIRNWSTNLPAKHFYNLSLNFINDGKFDEEDVVS